jgi:hypothetical protein
LVSSALIWAVSRKVVKPSVGDSRSSWIRPSSFSIVELARSRLVAQRAEALLLRRIEQALPGDP